MEGPRTLRRMLVALSVVLVLLEVLAVPLLVRQADAAERPGEAIAARHPSTLAPSAPAAARRVAAEPATEPVEHVLVALERSMAARSRPGGGPVVGTIPAASPFYGEPTVAWVLELSRDGRFGRVPVAYAGADVTGWIRLRGLGVSTTPLSVLADLSRHRLWVLRGDRVVLSAPATTGAEVSPTPTGRYVVSDRVAFPGGGSFGTYAFGLSGIQPNLPPGWTGGNQLAIHGTNDPSSIGRSASAGCLRVAERTLDRLRRLLRVGTPVLVRA
jgi:lipoprotein-anchoring transpeptidase ErfK/SrfK